MDRGAWRATVHGAAKSWTRQSTAPCTVCQIYFSFNKEALIVIPLPGRLLSKATQTFLTAVLRVRHCLYFFLEIQISGAKLRSWCFSEGLPLPLSSLFTMQAKSLQSCLSLCDLDYSPPVSYVPCILQARILQWVAMPFSRGSSWPGDRTRVPYVSCIGRRVLYHQCHLRSLSSSLWWGEELMV